MGRPFSFRHKRKRSISGGQHRRPAVCFLGLPWRPVASAVYNLRGRWSLLHPIFSREKLTNNVRAPKRKRPQPRIIHPPPAGVDVAGLALRVLYVGSPEHKTGASFAGAPRPRGDATKCDAALNDRLVEIQQWLEHAFSVQCFGGPWDGDFPRYAWCKIGNIVYEARLVNRGLGQYKGWQLEPDEWPDGIENYEWSE
jgi:hypothetical protein